MAEDRTEHADVKAAPEAHAQDGLLGHAVGYAEARREGRERAFLIQVQSDALAAGDQHFACVNVHEAAFARASHGLWTIEFPATAEVHCQILRNAPRVLAEEEPTVLALFRVECVADVTLEAANVAEQERRQASAATDDRLSPIFKAGLRVFLETGHALRARGVEI